MNKQIVAIIIGIALISLASALTYNITAGESTSFTLSEDFDYYSIVGNQSEVDLNIIQEGLNITILIGKYSRADSFEIIFFNKEEEIVHHYSSGGGGSSRTIYKDRNITEYIEVEKYIDKEVYKEDEEEIGEGRRSIKYLWFILGGLVVFIIILLITKKMSNRE